MKPETLIGKCVDITDKDSPWYRHWGFIIAYDDSYHVSGGSIATNDHEIVPIFDRDQFKVRK